IPGQVRHGALVAAVDPDRPLAAGGATALRLVGADDEGNQLRSGNDRVKPQETGISDQRWSFHTQRIPVPAVVYSLTFTKSAEEPRNAAVRFGISPPAVFRHRATHLPELLAAAQERA